MSAAPSPVTASFTSLGLYWTTGIPDRAETAEREPTGLAHRDRGAGVHLEEDPFHRDRTGPDLGDERFEIGLERREPRGQGDLRIGAQHAVRDRFEAGAGAGDRAVAAARQPGIDPENRAVGGSSVEHGFDPKRPTRPPGGLARF